MSDIVPPWAEAPAFSVRHGHGRGEMTRNVFVTGGGPPVVLLHELPGIHGQFFSLVDLLVRNGMSVWVPHFFGRMGQRQTNRQMLTNRCVLKEFAGLSTRKLGPAAHWTREMIKEVRARSGYDEVAVIGMCLTGGFALAMMAEEGVVAGAACQPSLPILPCAAFGMSKDEINAARTGMAAKGHAMALRASNDSIVPARRLRRIKEAFGEHVVVVSLGPTGHATLTENRNDDAMRAVFGYVMERLGISGPPDLN
ncbi:MAG: dienelactone hydrolase family protein [Pseudomonadota bacterium]